MKEAIDHYHHLLSSGYLDSTRELLEQQAGKLSVAGRPVCSVLRPFFLHRQSYDYVRNASIHVMKGIRVLIDRLLVDPSLRQKMSLTPDEEELIRIETGYGPADVSGRLDGFLAADGSFQFVEYNADSPGGLGYGNALSDVFSSMPIWEKFSERFPSHAIPIKSLVCDSLLSAYKKWGGTNIPNIAIIDWENVSTKNEFVILSDEFVKHGCKVQIGDPNDLDYTNGKLYLNGFPVDLIYKRLVVGELLRDLGLKHPMLNAVRDKAVCCVNGFNVQMSFKKALFVFLSDPFYSHFFPSDVNIALQKHIPWTRMVCERRTVYRDTSVDLIPFIYTHRNDLVLKPNSDYGGRGVILGWECSEEEWDSAVRSALENPYVVQERVKVGSEIYPSIIENKLSFDERFFDLDPYVWNGAEVEGCGVRLSKLALLNVSAGGGSATPLFVLE